MATTDIPVYVLLLWWGQQTAQCTSMYYCSDGDNKEPNICANGENRHPSKRSTALMPTTDSPVYVLLLWWEQHGAQYMCHCFDGETDIPIKVPLLWRGQHEAQYICYWSDEDNWQPSKRFTVLLGTTAQHMYYCSDGENRQSSICVTALMATTDSPVYVLLLSWWQHTALYKCYSSDGGNGQRSPSIFIHGLLSVVQMTHASSNSRLTVDLWNENNSEGSASGLT
jgi:hypothetical protein